MPGLCRVLASKLVNQSKNVSIFLITMLNPMINSLQISKLKPTLNTGLPDMKE